MSTEYLNVAGMAVLYVQSKELKPKNKIEQLVNDNIRLVGYVRMHKLRNLAYCEEQEAELYSCLLFGLYKAAKTYKPEMQVKDKVSGEFLFVAGKPVTQQIKFATWAIKILINEGLQWLRKNTRIHNLEQDNCSLDKRIDMCDENLNATISDVIADPQAEAALGEIILQEHFQKFCEIYREDKQFQIWYKATILGERQVDLALEYSNVQSYISKIVKSFQKIVSAEFQIYKEY